MQKRPKVHILFHLSIFKLNIIAVQVVGGKCVGKNKTQSKPVVSLRTQAPKQYHDEKARKGKFIIHIFKYII